MLGVLTRRLLPLLQLTRMALVFTAIADSWCEIFLQTKLHQIAGASVFGGLQPLRMAIIAGISGCLYGYGMSLNDIVDRRRDQTLASTRPLPSGRVALLTAHLTCALLGIASVVGGLAYAMLFGDWMALVLVAWTGALISFYDFAGKYLVAPGLVTLGLIRLFHCLIPAGEVPLVWHPLWLFNHITIVSTIAYIWEDKRPTLRRGHLAGVVIGLLVVNGVGLTVLMRTENSWPQEIQRLLLPAIATLIFVGLAMWIRRTRTNPQEAGKALMFYGLLWLIIYDASFAMGYAGWTPALVILALLPIAYLAVHVMRLWGKLMALSQTPQFQRARQ